MPNIQAQVALDKERHPERYCPARRCLWRSYGALCPRHMHLDGDRRESELVTAEGRLTLEGAAHLLGESV